MADLHDELELLDNQIFHAKEAIENLECVGDMEYITEAVRDHLRELTDEYNRVHASIEAQDDAAVDAMRDEYWRDAL